MQYAAQAVLVLVTATLSGCAVVKPYEREHLASRPMQQPRSQDPFAAEYRDKIVRTRTGGSLPATAPGGGCGCTQ